MLAYRLDCSGGQAETKRRIFEANLREKGLELEHESAEHSSDNNTYFVKIHCPFDVLCDGAEFINLKLPFKVSDTLKVEWVGGDVTKRCGSLSLHLVKRGFMHIACIATECMRSWLILYCGHIMP